MNQLLKCDISMKNDYNVVNEQKLLLKTDITFFKTPHKTNEGLFIL